MPRPRRARFSSVVVQWHRVQPRCLHRLSCAIYTVGRRCPRTTDRTHARAKHRLAAGLAFTYGLTVLVDTETNMSSLYKGATPLSPSTKGVAKKQVCGAPHALHS